MIAMNNSYPTPGIAFFVLKLKYKVINHPERIPSAIMGILKRRERGTKLSLGEINTLKAYGFSGFQTQENYSSNTLYQILNKVEPGGNVNQVDLDWLTTNNLFNII